MSSIVKDYRDLSATQFALFITDETLGYIGQRRLGIFLDSDDLSDFFNATVLNSINTASVTTHEYVAPTFVENKAAKIAAIDTHTAELIVVHPFQYDSVSFSMSEHAQSNWIGLGMAHNMGLVSFPYTISALDETSYVLEGAADLVAFIGTAMVYQSSPDEPLASGRTLRAAAAAATDQAELDAVVDDRT